MAEETQFLRTPEGYPYVQAPPEGERTELGRPQVIQPPADLKKTPMAPSREPDITPPEQKSEFQWWAPGGVSPSQEEEERTAPTFRERQRAYLESLRAAEEGEAPQVAPPEREYVSGKEGPSWEESIFGETPPAELLTNPDKYTVAEDSSVVDKQTGQVVYRPIPGSPFEIAAQRQKEAAMPREGRPEGWITEHPDLNLVIPRSPLDVALYATTGPFKPLVKAGLLATGAILESDEAQAGISGTIRNLGSKLFGKLPPPPTVAPPPMVPVPKPPRKIIRGASDREPTSFDKIYTL